MDNGVKPQANQEDLEHLDKMIENGRLMRERGSIQASLELFSTAKNRALMLNAYEHACRAIGEAVVAHQLLYELGEPEEKPDRKNIVLEQTKEGLDITRLAAWLDREKASVWNKIFVYRRGVINFLDKEYDIAQTYFEDIVGKTSKQEDQYPEFASYYGVCLVLTGQKELGLMQLVKAYDRFKIFQKEIPPRFLDWHAMIIEAGIQMRFAIAAHHIGDKFLYKTAMVQAKSLAYTLAKKHNLTLRQQQFELLKQEL